MTDKPLTEEELASIEDRARSSYIALSLPFRWFKTVQRLLASHHLQSAQVKALEDDSGWLQYILDEAARDSRSLEYACHKVNEERTARDVSRAALSRNGGATDAK